MHISYTTVTVKQSIANSKRKLVTGDHSSMFQGFLKKHGISKKEIARFESGGLTEQMKFKIALLNEYNALTSVLLDYYKSTGARGLSMYDELVNLKSQILEREKYLRDQGKDPLEDTALRIAKNREFEIIKFLERIKFEKEKIVVEDQLKKDRDSDILFVSEE